MHREGRLFNTYTHPTTTVDPCRVYRPCSYTIKLEDTHSIIHPSLQFRTLSRTQMLQVILEPDLKFLPAASNSNMNSRP